MGVVGAGELAQARELERVHRAAADLVPDRGLAQDNRDRQLLLVQHGLLARQHGLHQRFLIAFRHGRVC